MTAARLTAERWEDVLSFANEFTCYSAAVATWQGAADAGWPAHVGVGLWMRLTEEADGLFGFAYFPPRRRAELGLVRIGTDDEREALEGVGDELARSGRVIVAGDGFHLPWHVGAGRHHLPHWFVLAEAGDGGELEIADPFACRNELGVQQPTRHAVASGELAGLLPALPGDNPVHTLRERLALGDDTDDAISRRFQWFVAGEPGELREPHGFDGPQALERLARHFRDHGQDPSAYLQADDIWSIGRHRAFLVRYAQRLAAERGDAALAAWAEEHGLPLIKRWGHVAPLIMQATLTLRAGREATASVPDTLDALATLEAAAAAALPQSI